MHADYSIYGVVVRVSWNSPEVARAAGDLTNYFALYWEERCACDPHIVLDLPVVEPTWGVPTGAEELGSLEADAKVWRAGGRLYLGGDAALMKLDVAAGVGTGYIRPSVSTPRAIRSYAHGLLLHSLVLLLHRQRLFALHSAAVARDDEGILFVAQSDSGKSTLAYSLVREGWSYVSDDSVLLTPSDEGTRALAFRQTAGLDRDAARIFPELQADWNTQFGESDKWSIPIDLLYPQRKADHCTPRLLIYPELVPRAESEAIKVNRVEAMHRLLMQSTTATTDRTITEAHLDTLRQLTTQCRAFRLFAGQDLIEDPARAARMIGDILSSRQE